MSKYLVQVEATGDLHGAFLVDANTNEEAAKKAVAAAATQAVWGPPKNIRAVVAGRTVLCSNQPQK